jgi:hypothetical protein
MQELLALNIPAIQHGYDKMTLLDPHPANLLLYGPDPSRGAIAPNAYYDPGLDPLGPGVVEGFYNAFESLTVDPPVKVPARVNDWEEIFQQNRGDFTSIPFPESLLNLWGLDPNGFDLLGNHNIQVEDPTFSRLTTLVDLTGQPGIGHTEVHQYYQDNFIPPSPPPAPPPSRRGASNEKRPVLEAAQLFVERPSGASSLSFADSVSGVAAPPEGNAVIRSGQPSERSVAVDRIFGSINERRSLFMMLRPLKHIVSADDLFPETGDLRG